ncbi:hypothetical protein MBLNU457_g2614t1 [Dothideomycetes sp. NU457]
MALRGKDSVLAPIFNHFKNIEAALSFNFPGARCFLLDEEFRSPAGYCNQASIRQFRELMLREEVKPILDLLLEQCNNNFGRPMESTWLYPREVGQLAGPDSGFTEADLKLDIRLPDIDERYDPLTQPRPRHALIRWIACTSIIDALHDAEVFKGPATGCASSKLWGYEAEDLNRANWMCYSYLRSNGFIYPEFTQKVGSYTPKFITDVMLSDFKRQLRLANKRSKPESTPCQPSAPLSIASAKRAVDLDGEDEPPVQRKRRKTPLGSEDTTALPDRNTSQTRSLQQIENTPAPAQPPAPPATPAPAQLPQQPQPAISPLPTTSPLEQDRNRAFNHLYHEYGGMTSHIPTMMNTRRQLRSATNLQDIFRLLAIGNRSDEEASMLQCIVSTRTWLLQSYGSQISSPAGYAMLRELDNVRSEEEALAIMVRSERTFDLPDSPQP